MTLGVTEALFSEVTVYFEGWLWIRLAVEEGYGSCMGTLEVRGDDRVEADIGIGFTKRFRLLWIL